MTFDESKHPRAPAGKTEGGQFIDKDSILTDEVEIYRAARFAANLPADPDEQKRFEAYRKFQLGLEIKAKGLDEPKLTFELASIIGPDGEFITDRAGEDWEGSGIRFNDEEMEAAAGNYIIHNHPNESGFSKADLTFSAKSGLAGIIATTQEGMFIADFNQEVISTNPDYYSLVLEQIHDTIAMSAQNMASNYITNHGWTADAAMTWAGKETMEGMNNSKHTKDLIQIRWVDWVMPKMYEPR